MSLSVLLLGSIGVAFTFLNVQEWFDQETTLAANQEMADYVKQLSWAQGGGLAVLICSFVGALFVRARLTQGAAPLAGGSAALPVLLDCNDVPAVKALAASIPDPALAALLLRDTDPGLASGWLRQEVERLRGRGPVSIVLARAGR